MAKHCIKQLFMTLQQILMSFYRASYAQRGILAGLPAAVRPSGFCDPMRLCDFYRASYAQRGILAGLPAAGRPSGFCDPMRLY